MGDAGRTVLYFGPSTTGSLHLADSSISLTDTFYMGAMLVQGIPSVVERSRFVLGGSATNGTTDYPGGVIQAVNSDFTLRNCIIDSRAATVSCEELMHLHGASACIQNNTFRFNNYGLSLNDRVQASIDNNLFLQGNGYGGGVRLRTNESLPLFLRNNYFSSLSEFDEVMYADQEGAFGTAWFAFDMPTVISYLSDRNCLVTGNIAIGNDTQAYIGSNGELLAAAPSAIGTGALNLSAVFSTDILGQSRPASGAWSIGAYGAP